MSSDSGWIKIHRKMIEWEWYSDSNTKALFLHLLLTANYAENKWCGITIKRGQLITSRDKLSKLLGISPQTIRTCIKRLISTSEITIQPTNKFSLLTVINYNDYQTLEQSINQQNIGHANQQPTNNQPTTNQQPTTNKKTKKTKKDKNNQYKGTDTLCEVESLVQQIVDNTNSSDLILFKGKYFQVPKGRFLAWMKSLTLTKYQLVIALNGIHRQMEMRGGKYKNVLAYVAKALRNKTDEHDMDDFIGKSKQAYENHYVFINMDLLDSVT